MIANGDPRMVVVTIVGGRGQIVIDAAASVTPHQWNVNGTGWSLRTYHVTVATAGDRELVTSCPDDE